MKTCYIFGAAEGFPKIFKKDNTDLVISADAGYKYLKEYNIIPDIALGDFDSLGYEPLCNEVIRHPVMKDDTDTLLAVKVAIGYGYKKIVLFGCYGKRPDHTYANLQILTFASENNIRCYLNCNDYYATTLKNGSLSFKAKKEGTVSVFSITEQSKGVNLHNLLYRLDNAVIKNSFPIGVSNEFINKSAKIEVQDGTLLIMWSGTPDDIQE